MDATRRAELEQEKSKLLIELEAVAASHAVWEQAFQKATLEQEQVRKEEQQLVQRRDMLRMLVEAASDQTYRAEEDYRKLQAEEPLMTAAKIDETERLQSLQRLIKETHANQAASYKETIQKFSNAPWVQALKKKEELLARTKQQVKEKEIEAAELVAELTKFRESVDNEIENPTCVFVAEVAALEQRLVLLRMQKDEEQRMSIETQIFNSPNRRRSDATVPQQRTILTDPSMLQNTLSPLVRRIQSRPTLLTSTNRTPGSAKKSSTTDPLEIIQPTPSPPLKRRSQATPRSDISLKFQRQYTDTLNESQQLSTTENTVDEGYAEHRNNNTRNNAKTMEFNEESFPLSSVELQEGNESQESQINGDVVPDSNATPSFPFNLSGNTTNSAAVRTTSPVFAVPELPERFQIQNNNNKKKNQSHQNRSHTMQTDLNASIADGDGNSDFFNILENETGGGDEDDSPAAFSFLNSQSSTTPHSTDGGFNFNFDDDDNNESGGGGSGFFF